VYAARAKCGATGAPRHIPARISRREGHDGSFTGQIADVAEDSTPECPTGYRGFFLLAAAPLLTIASLVRADTCTIQDKS
jgi:hypothetical protein